MYDVNDPYRTMIVEVVTFYILVFGLNKKIKIRRSD